jgi:hypothetical protein
MVVYACKAKAGGSEVLGQLEQLSEILCQKRFLKRAGDIAQW